MLQMPTALRQCYAFLFRRRRLELLLLILLVAASGAAIRLDFHCSCEDEGHGAHGGGAWTGWVTAEALAQCQKVSDFLIAAAYFSIPLELLYFASCPSDFPSSFKRVLFQFGAFIVPCGFVHFLAALAAQHAPHHLPHILSLALAASKLLTAVVSLATAVSQLTLLPQLLRAKTKEDLLRRKARDLDREVGDLRRREQAGWDVGMLVRQIRSSLDRHAVLSTTVAELSKALGLRNCAVWMPIERGGEACLTLVQEHLIRRNSRGLDGHRLSVPVDSPEAAEISATAGAKILAPGSRLAQLSGGADGAVVEVAAAVRVLMHDASGEEVTTDPERAVRYAVLVSVLPHPDDDEGVDWGEHELEVLEVVADEVSVALSHAAALEEVQLERARLREQKEAIERATARAVAANEAGASLFTALLREMRGPAQSIASLVDALAWEPGLGSEQKLAVDALSKVGAVLPSLVDGFGTEHSEAVGGADSGFLALEARPYQLCPMIKAVAGIAKALCLIRHFPIDIHADGLPDLVVVGDEKRVVELIMHMLGGLLAGVDEGDLVNLRVRSDCNVKGSPEQRWAPWKMRSFPDGHVNVEFKIAIKKRYGSKASSVSSSQLDWASGGDGFGLGLTEVTFNKCKRLVQMMQGNMWVMPDSQGYSKTAILLIPFQLRRQTPDRSIPQQPSSASCDGLRVLLADGDSVSRATTRILLERLGCRVCAVASESQCLIQLRGSRPPPFDVVILDVDMPDGDAGAFEVSAQIRKFRSASWPLVLALVGDGREGVWERCLQAGMAGMIRKPVTRRVIADELCRVLRSA